MGTGWMRKEETLEGLAWEVGEPVGVVWLSCGAALWADSLRPAREAAALRAVCEGGRALAQGRHRASRASMLI